MASIEQKKSDESVLRLVEEQKREIEEALKKLLELERQLDAKQKLEMEIEELKGKLQVMKHLGDEDDAVVQEKIKEMDNELEAKMEEMENMENLTRSLVVKERQSNDELQDARKVLIKTHLEKSLKRNNDKQLIVKHELPLKVKTWLKVKKYPFRRLESRLTSKLVYL